MSNSVPPHRRQPTRLPHPWDSLGKNTGVGCHFLLQCMKVKSKSEVAQLCPTLSDPMDCNPPGSSIHGIFQARVLEWGAIAFSDSPFIPTYFPPIIKQGQKETQVFHCCSITKLCPTLCDLMNYSTPSCPVLHYLQESESVSCSVLSDSL